MKRKQIIALCVCAALVAGGVLGFFAYQKLKKPKVPTTYPYVFVHGLNGFGDDAGMPVSYWGATAGALLPELQKEGFTCYAPSVNPVGSAWDRACELYAQLAGVRVDYGIAHSAQFEHERFGQTYDAPLFPGWGQEDEDGNLRKVTLIAHSFGGATARVLCALLQNGSRAEMDTAVQAGEVCSGLFTGGKGEWVFSLTCLAAPHNGTSLLSMVASWIGGLGIDDALAAVGFSVGGARISEILRMAKTMDTAYYDLSLKGAKEVNAQTALCPESYYFSYPIDGTRNGAPTDDMTLKLKLPGYAIGMFTAPEEGIDERWKPNDGLVNTISATAPFGEPSVVVSDPAALTPDALRPASWYVMPTVRGDHGTIIGLERTMEQTLPLYLEQMRRIDALSRKATGG
jgi:triacylglycerol esterase/lipase EstA (alpha/beta hydrolase family)